MFQRFLAAFAALLACFQPSANPVGPGNNNNGGVNNGGVNNGGAQGVPHAAAAVAGGGGPDDGHPSRTENAASDGTVAAPSASSTGATATATATATAGTAVSNADAPVASVSVEGSQGTTGLEIGQHVEYRWGSGGKWYQCVVTKVTGGGTSEEVELEFLPRKKRKTKAGRVYSEILSVVELKADGDIAAAGTNLGWE